MVAKKKTTLPVHLMVAVSAILLLLATRSRTSASAAASSVATSTKGGSSWNDASTKDVFSSQSVTPPASYRRRLLSQEDPKGFALVDKPATEPDAATGAFEGRLQTTTAKEPDGFTLEKPLPAKGPPGREGQERRRDERCGVGGGFAYEPGTVPDSAPSGEGGDGGQRRSAREEGMLEGAPNVVADPCDRRGARRRQLPQLQAQQQPQPSREDEQRLLQELFDSHFQPPDEHNTGKIPRPTASPTSWKGVESEAPASAPSSGGGDGGDGSGGGDGGGDGGGGGTDGGDGSGGGTDGGNGGGGGGGDEIDNDGSNSGSGGGNFGAGPAVAVAVGGSLLVAAAVILGRRRRQAGAEGGVAGAFDPADGATTLDGGESAAGSSVMASEANGDIPGQGDNLLGAPDDEDSQGLP